MFQREKAQLKEMLLGVRRVSLTVDSWTSDNWVALVGVTVHWINENWKLCERVLTLFQLEGEHTSEHLAKVLFISLKEFSLEKKICAVTTNNVSNNKTMISALATTLGSLNPDFNQKSHLPCLAHVLNLAVQDGLRHLHISSPPTVTDSTSASLEENETFLASSQSLRDVVTRVRQVVKAIRSSPHCLKQYKHLCHDLQTSADIVPPLDCPTCWNSTYKMLLSAYEKRDVLEKMAIFILSDIPHRNYLITSAEWDMVRDFTILLELFQEAIEFLCQLKRVTSSKAFLVVRALLESMKGHGESLKEGLLFVPGAILDEEQQSTIQAACRAMILRMEKYEEQLHGCDAYAVAAMLDPESKMCNIPPHDQEKLKTHIWQMFNELADDNISADIGPMSTNSRQDGSHQPSSHPRANRGTFASRLAQLTSRPQRSSKDEIQSYLQLETINEDALTWWRQDGRRTFPKLTTLAKDFLTVCATSASTERFFLSDKKVVPFAENRLKAESVSTLMTLKCWLQQMEEDSSEMHMETMSL